MKRTLFGFAFLIPALAYGQVAPTLPNVPDPLAPPHTTPFLLSGDRAVEVNAGVALQMDWNGVLGVQAPSGHAGVLAGAELGLPAWDQRFRISAFFGVKGGTWGDDAHGLFALVPGARVRLSPFMWDVFDLYAVARVDFPIDVHAGAAVRPGLGIGMRVARMLSVEATYDVMAPIGNTFAGTTHPNFVPYGVTFGVMFDACFQCNHSDPTPVDHDMACRLYEAARTCPQSAKDEICAAIPQAMMTAPDVFTASRDDDGLRPFLDKLTQLVKTPDAKKAVDELTAFHHAMLEHWREYESAADRAAAEHRSLAERWTYAPVPAELRSYLGCKMPDGSVPPAPPTCDEVPKQP